MLKKRVVYGGLIILGALLMAAAIIEVPRLQYAQNGRFYIPKQYARVRLPSALRYQTRSWDDVNTFDSSLESEWTYHYQIANSADLAEVDRSVTSELSRQGFTIIDPSTNAGVYTFSANNSRLSLLVSIGNACTVGGKNCPSVTSGNGVTISASLPADKANLTI